MIVGRNQEENKMLLELKNPEDIAYEVIGIGSPIALLKKQKDEDDLRQAAELCIHYSDSKKNEKLLLQIKHYNKCEILNLHKY